MSDLIKKPAFCLGYYIWQDSSFGKSHFNADDPCEIWKFRPQPCTPAGDLVGRVATARRAAELLSAIEGKPLEEAARIVAEAGE